MRIVVNKYLIGRHFVGIALWPFIVIRDPSLRKDEIFVNHERIHLRQQLELLIIPFYILYLLEYLIRFWIYRNPKKAYRMLSFEREAYENEGDLEYLGRRRAWSFLQYF